MLLMIVYPYFPITTTRRTNTTNLARSFESDKMLFHAIFGNVYQTLSKVSAAAIWGTLIPSDFVVHSFRPPMEEAMRRLWSQLG